MNTQEFVTKYFQDYPEFTINCIGNILLSAAKSTDDEVFMNCVNLVEKIDVEQLSSIIRALCENNKFKMVLLLSEHDKRITTKMFNVKNAFNPGDQELYFLQIVENQDSDFVKKFITRFPDMFSYIKKASYLDFTTRSEKILNTLYDYHGYNMIEFICPYICNYENFNNYLTIFFKLSFGKNDIVTLKFLLTNFIDKLNIYKPHFISNDYHPESMDLIFEFFPDLDVGKFCNYHFLLSGNNTTMLKYLFNKAKYNYVKKICYVTQLHSYNLGKIKSETFDLVIQDILDKKLLNNDNYEILFKLLCRVKLHKYFHVFKECVVSRQFINEQFRKFCQDGYYNGAYELKRLYQNISLLNIKCDKQYQDLYDWLDNGCPINRETTTSS